MAKSKLDNNRLEMMNNIKTYLESKEFEVLETNSNELCVPIVSDDNEEEGYLVMTFKIPTGSRDGDIYDGYEMANEYAIKKAERIEKAKESARKKAEKIERDKKLREKKAEQKAKHNS